MAGGEADYRYRSESDSSSKSHEVLLIIRTYQGNSDVIDNNELIASPLMLARKDVVIELYGGLDRSNSTPVRLFMGTTSQTTSKIQW